jgi:hypothetical protein
VFTYESLLVNPADARQRYIIEEYDCGLGDTYIANTGKAQSTDHK